MELARNPKPVHIAYTKEINTRRHARSPQKTVRGNVLTFVPERTIDRFNMPVYTGDIPLFIKKREHQRMIAGQPRLVSESQRMRRGNNDSVRRVKLLWREDYYLINFPEFFSIPMIRDSLYLLMKANLEETKFMVLPSQKVRSIFIGNADMVRVFVGNGTLSAASNTDLHWWGEPCLISAPIRRKQTQLKLGVT